MLQHFNTLNFLILFIQSSRPHSKITNMNLAICEISLIICSFQTTFLLFDFKNKIFEFGLYLDSATPPYYERPGRGGGGCVYLYKVKAVFDMSI